MYNRAYANKELVNSLGTNMPMLTKPQLLKKIKQGDLFTVKNECVLYGKIVALYDWGS